VGRRPVTDLFAEPEGATPLDDESQQGLRRSDIAFRHELDAAEADNIGTAVVWAFGRRRPLPALLTEAAIRDLHRRMFGDVWRWAGRFRTRETNIGVDPHRIGTELATLLQDVLAQGRDPGRLAWPADEIAVRYHHRLVSIHAFPNGNGRHARLAADLVAEALDRPRFAWGRAGHLSDASAARTRYLRALRVADKEYDYAPLLEFARG
jgi:Fic-DOC domain mobile mystery protein B